MCGLAYFWARAFLIASYTGPLTPLAYVIANTHHRHMSAGQKAVMALEIERYEAEEAKERQIRKPSDSVKEIIPEQKGQARDKAAAAVGVNPRYVSDAKHQQVPRIGSQRGAPREGEGANS